MSRKKLNPDDRYRNWCCVLWCEDPSHNEAVATLLQDYNCVGILHDRDTKKANFIDEDNLGIEKHEADKLALVQKPHYHFIIRFKNAVYRAPLAKDLGITVNYLEPMESWYGAAKYLLHIGHPEKFQYDTFDLVGPLRSSVDAMVDEYPQEEIYLQIISHIDTLNRSISEKEFQHFCIDKGYWRVMKSCYNLLKSYVYSHNEKFINKKEKEN